MQQLAPLRSISMKILAKSCVFLYTELQQPEGGPQLGPAYKLRMSLTTNNGWKELKTDVAG